LSRVGAKWILDHYRYFRSSGVPRPPHPLSHHGIGFAFPEKGSIVFYLHNGRWL
jgi:hypothetical protein